jgi:hypothetical protein
MNSNREAMESLLIDYLDNQLSAAEREKVEGMLAADAGLRHTFDELKTVLGAIEHSRVPEPSPRLRERFRKTLNAAAGHSESKVIRLTPSFYRIAAAVALLVIGGGTGYWISRRQQQEKELAAMKRQLEETRSLVVRMLDNENSASQRLLGVQAALTTSAPDDRIVTALFKAMTSDGNSNVRLAALEALSRFRDEPGVRSGLIDALSTQSDPLVQMALIQLMVEMKEKESLPRLRKLTEDANSMESVRDEASAALIRLREV